MALINVTKDNFDETVNSGKTVLLDFWATWCGPCMMLAPTIEALAKEYAGKVKVCKVNVDENMELAIRYKVEAIPTLIYIKNGEVVQKAVGALDKNQIIKMFI